VRDDGEYRAGPQDETAHHGRDDNRGRQILVTCCAV
jgi:hypothetical protein